MADRYPVAIVDDDEGVRHASGVVLARAGHVVKSFTNGPEFLASDLPKNLGCILLDMQMPGMTGIDVMRALKEGDYVLYKPTLNR